MIDKIPVYNAHECFNALRVKCIILCNIKQKTRPVAYIAGICVDGAGSFNKGGE